MKSEGNARPWRRFLKFYGYGLLAELVLLGLIALRPGGNLGDVCGKLGDLRQSPISSVK